MNTHDGFLYSHMIPKILTGCYMILINSASIFLLLDNRVAQINWDPSTTAIVTVFNDYSYNSAVGLSSSITIVRAVRSHIV